MNCPRCGTSMRGGICPECGFPINRIMKKRKCRFESVKRMVSSNQLAP